MKRLRTPLLLCIMLIAFSSHAEGFKTLLMPGKLSDAHHEIEDDCDACHDTSSKERQAELCMDCHSHEDILDDVSNKTGFHGRLGMSLVNDCKHCHTDHKGRDFNITPLNKTTFDHDSTDFELHGAHTRLACSSCHDSGKKYSQAQSTCFACHENDDIHDGKQGKKCQSCHDSNDWKKSSFDHSKTDFPLKGAHKDTLCSSCHVNKAYKDTPQKCVSCHGIQDIHLKTFGERCDECHSTKDWTRARYDHGKNTGFLLLGKHEQTTCNGCHKPGSDAAKTGDSCYDCHRFDDHHKGRFGKDCNSCHTPKSWAKDKFDHSKTDFPLTGKHRDTSCNYCHRGQLKQEKLETACYACHKSNDVHKGSQGKDCANCHDTSGWRDSKGFDHDLSLFPLIGLHAITQCEECHVSSDYQDTETACIECHDQDDTHDGRLGTDCGTCHNPNAWDAWVFEHEKSTGFKLDGSHEDLACYDCHHTDTDSKLSTSSDCIGCHRNDDIHRGQFGRRCDQCHDTEDFRTIRMSR